MSRKILSKLPNIRKKSAEMQNPQTCAENFQNPQICGEIRKSGNTDETFPIQPGLKSRVPK